MICDLLLDDTRIFQQSQTETVNAGLFPWEYEGARFDPIKIAYYVITSFRSDAANLKIILDADSTQ